MSSKKGTGSTKNGRDSNPKFLGCKLYDGQEAKIGMIIYRQRGNKIWPGKNVGQGKDHTLFALSNGKVKYTTFEKYKTRVDIIDGLSHEFTPGAPIQPNETTATTNSIYNVRRHNHVTHRVSTRAKTRIESALKLVKANKKKRVELKHSDQPYQIVARTEDRHLVIKGGTQVPYNEVMRQIKHNVNTFFIKKKTNIIITVDNKENGDYLRCVPDNIISNNLDELATKK